MSRVVCDASAVVTVLGLALSYLLNAPSGPIIVVLLGLGLAVLALFAREGASAGG